MTRTLTALFDNKADADAAKERLRAAHVDVTHVHVYDQKTEGYSSTDYSSDENQGFWKKLTGMFLPEEDRHTYEEGVRRGGVIVTADVPADQADSAARILEESSVDLDSRTGEWKKSGWAYQPTAAAAKAPLRQPKTDDKDRIELVEERLSVGKREVERGGVRVRSYVVETPVHEQVTLRDENISVDRRPVDRPVSVGDDAFKERTIAMTARGEEAVVGKQAHVREEVVLNKKASQHTETVNDTVRHTEVEVENAVDPKLAGTTTANKRI